MEAAMQNIIPVIPDLWRDRFSPVNPREAKIMSEPIRGDFVIHVDVKAILENRELGAHEPVIAVRQIGNLTEHEMVRALAWDGPTRFVHHDHMTIPGTNVQNWVETDEVLTAWQDRRGMSVMLPRPSWGGYRPMTDNIRGKWVIHVAAPVLMRNRKEGRDDPVIAVRSAETDWATDVVFCRRVEWRGPTRMVHRPTTPIPGTDGRGVCFVETDAPLTLYRDGEAPIVMEKYQNVRAAA
jgi:hypothetical protein